MDLRPFRLFVIGEHRDDGGPICLNLASTAPDGDCPVVFVDHETGERTVVFSSTARMFDCLAMAAATATDIFSGRMAEGASLEERRELARSFLALDASGAGGPGRAFWCGQLATASKEAQLTTCCVPRPARVNGWRVASCNAPPPVRLSVAIDANRRPTARAEWKLRIADRE